MNVCELIVLHASVSRSKDAETAQVTDFEPVVPVSHHSIP